MWTKYRGLRRMDKRRSRKKEIQLKKKRTILAGLCLCACLGVAACSKSTQDGEQESTVKYESAFSVDNGTLKDDSIAVSVGKTKITYAEYKAYDYFMKNQFESILGKEVWNYKLNGSGRTIGQDAIEDVLRLIIQVKVITKAAGEQNVVLAADEKEAADNSAVKFCETLSDKEKKEHGINAALLCTIFEENKLAEKMYNIIVGKAEVKIPESQCHAARVQLLYLKADAASRESVLKTAGELRVKASGADSFYTFAKKNTQAEKVEYLVGQQDSRKKLGASCLSLKQGAVSGVIEEDDGFYIAYCVETDSKALREEYKNQVVEERQNEAFASAYSGWAAGYEVKASRSLLVNE